MANNAIQNLAKAILALHKRTKSVPNYVREACRKVISGSGSAQDTKTIQDYWGVQGKGSSKLKRDLRSAGSPYQKVGQYTSLLDATFQGGAIGIAGAVGLAGQLNNDVQTLTKSKMVRDFAVSAAQKYQSVAERFGYQGFQDGDAGKGAVNTLQTLRHLSKFVSTAAIAVELVHANANLAQGIIDSASGRGDVEKKRISESQYNLTINDRTKFGAEKELAKARWRNDQNMLSGGYGSVPVWGQLLTRFDKNITSADKIEAQIAARSGSGDSENLWDTARHRHYLNQYGNPEDAASAEWADKKFGTSRENSAAILAELKRTVAAAKQYTDKFHELAESKNFAAAEQYKKAANEERPNSVPDSIDAGKWYRGAESTRISERTWAYNQMPRAGPREH